MPIAIKDDTDVAGQVTAHGSLGHGGPAAADAEVVRRLRAAGAVLLGKTHVPELEALATTESLAFGATRNPWDPARIAGGSSGGSAAAVAAGLAAAALGTDGAGSIRIPAACCGLFGLKPQRDRVPMARDWHGMSTTGPLTRGVLDAALFYDAVKQAARRSPRRRRARPAGCGSPTRSPCRAARPRACDPEMRGLVERTAARLRDLGHAVEQRDPDYGSAIVRVTTRYLEGISSDAAAMAHPERLARWTRGLVRMGDRIPRRAGRAGARPGGGRPRPPRRAVRRLRRPADARRSPAGRRCSARGSGCPRR